LPLTSTSVTAEEHQARRTARRARRDRFATLLVVNVTALMLVVATTSVNVALPDIQRHFGLSATGLSWVITGYALAFAGLLLVSGKLGAIYGSKRTLLVGTVIFLIASIVTGLAPGAGVLIAARIVQGVGAAVAAPSTLALLIATTEPGHRRHQAIGIYVLARNAGVGIGVLLGGILTSAAGWEWVMYINVPVSIVIFVATWLFVAETERKQIPLDYLGGVISTLVMAALVIGFTDAAQDGWGSWQALVPLAVAVAAGAVLALVERRHEDAVVPLQLFAGIRQVAPYVALLLVLAGTYAFFYFGSLFMEEVMHYDALRTGLAILPFVLAIVIVSQITPRLMHTLGERAAATAGAAIVTAGLLWLAALNNGSTFTSGLLGPELVIGLGIGLSTGPITSLIVHHAPTTHGSEASAMLQAMLQLGGAVGIASLTSLYVHGTAAGGLARGVSDAVYGGAAFAAVAIVFVGLWGTRVTARRKAPTP
jgi:EmrB/QacA subfamily drug resistance transporter